MATETCGICEGMLAYADAVHVTVHTKSDLGVVDGYLCRSCYERSLEEPFGWGENDAE